MDFGPLGDRSIFIWGSLKDDILAWIETWNWFYNCNILKDLSPKRRGHTYNQHHQTPEYSTLTRFWSKMLHTHRQTPQDLFDPQDLRSTHYALWTHSHLQTFESPDPCLPLLTHTRIPAKRTISFNIHKVFTPESTSSRFISIHRTSVVSIRSLAVSLSWISSVATNRQELPNATEKERHLA
jgi:hypothetical protein